MDDKCIVFVGSFFFFVCYKFNSCVHEFVTLINVVTNNNIKPIIMCVTKKPYGAQEEKKNLTIHNIWWWWWLVWLAITSNQTHTHTHTFLY